MDTGMADSGFTGRRGLRMRARGSQIKLSMFGSVPLREAQLRVEALAVVALQRRMCVSEEARPSALPPTWQCLLRHRGGTADHMRDLDREALHMLPVVAQALRAIFERYAPDGSMDANQSSDYLTACGRGVTGSMSQRSMMAPPLAQSRCQFGVTAACLENCQTRACMDGDDDDAVSLADFLCCYVDAAVHAPSTVWHDLRVHGYAPSSFNIDPAGSTSRPLQPSDDSFPVSIQSSETYSSLHSSAPPKPLISAVSSPSDKDACGRSGQSVEAASQQTAAYVVASCGQPSSQVVQTLLDPQFVNGLTSRTRVFVTHFAARLSRI